MGFIEDINLVAIARRTIAGRISQLAYLVNAAVGGRIDLDHVHRAAGAHLNAGFADAAGLRGGPVRFAIHATAVQRHGQNAGDRSFADPAMSTENIAMRNPLLLNGVLQGAGDVLLPNDFRKFLWTVFAREDLVAHGRRCSDYTSPHNCGTFGCINEKSAYSGYLFRTRTSRELRRKLDDRLRNAASNR